MTQETRSPDWVPDLLTFLRRRWPTIAVSTAAAMALGVAFLLHATPKFTASSTLVIDTLAAASLQQQQPLTDSQFANGIVESQLEVLQSERVARMVVQRLKLADDAGFLANGHSLVNSIIGPVMSLFEPPTVLTKDGREQAAAELLLHMAAARRIGMSYVIELDVTARSAQSAARLANALVDAYVDVGLDAKSDNVRRAGAWLQQRLGELHDQALAADAAVQAFKAQSNIVDTDKGLMNERHLGELNSQLVLARTRTAEARARAERITDILRRGDLTGDVSDAVQNEAIVKLRKDYDDTARLAAEWTAEVGAGHGAVRGLRERLRTIAAQLRTEYEHVAQGYESDYREAQASEQDIERQLAGLSAQGEVTNASLVRLRALQSSATTYRSLYENFLQRYTQAVQDQSFPVSEVQIVTRAVAPLRKSQPKGTLILAGAMMLGLAAGFGIAFLRESLAGGLRSPAQVRSALGLPCLGVLPALRGRQLRARARRARAPTDADAGNIIRDIPPLLRQPLLAPYSPFSETVRGLRVRIAGGREPRARVRSIGCVSALPGEGKTTVSANLALFLAQSGFRTLLVDLDMRRQTLSSLLVPERRAGFAELIAGTAGAEAALWREPATGLAFLPASGTGTSTHRTADRWLPERVTALLEELRQHYDYIVADLPAMAAVADAAAMAHWLDGLLVVAAWGRTPVDAVQEALAASDLDRSRLLGVVLNQADTRALPYYAAAGDRAAVAPSPLSRV